MALSNFIRSFNEAYNTGNQVTKDFSIANLLADQGQEVNQPDLSGVGQTGSLDQQDTPIKKGIKFLGQVYDPQDKAKIEEARKVELANIYDKYGDSDRADRIRSSINQAKLSDIQLSQAQSQQRQTKRLEDLQAKADAVNNDIANYAKQYTTNPDGTARQLTYDDQLHLGQYQASKLVSAGMIDDANKIAAQNLRLTSDKINVETNERNQALGQAAAAAASGDLTGVKNFYNKYIPDGAQTTDIVQGKNGIVVKRVNVDGSPLPDHRFKDVNELIAAAQSVNKPDALYNYATNELRNNLQQQQLNISKQSLGLQQHRSQVEDALQARNIRKQEDAANASVDLYQQLNPNATDQQLRAVRSGILPVVGNKGQYKVEANDVTQLLGSPAVDDKGAPITDPLTGRQLVNRNVAKEQEFFRFMKDNNIVDTNAGLAQFLARGSSGNLDEKSAIQQANAAIQQGAPKEAVNQRLKQLGFKPIP